MTSKAPTKDFEVTIPLGLDDDDEQDELARLAARQLGVSPADLPPLELRRRSIDARRGRIRFLLLVGPKREPANPAPPREVNVKEPPVLIVGGGPAGLFCAYELARQGIASVVIERGKQVQARRHDLAALQKRGVLSQDSNYCFGEGGAGTYSDGKLYTRSHKRGDTRDVLEVLVKHGAPERILVDARPHIGSNRLPKVVTGLRQALENVGVRFLYDSRVTGLSFAGTGGDRRCLGATLAGGGELTGSSVVIATGHSARSVYQMVVDASVAVEAKPFALGVRVEHPQPLINQIQYGPRAGHPKLGAASYRLAHNVEKRGVFSFCMCPGGWIVPAATEAEHLVVNGMSLSKRDSAFANSGLVVSIQPEDWVQAGFDPVTGGLEFQRAIEREAFTAGGGSMRAPATRVTDFLAGRASSTVPDASYIPGLSAGDISEVLDAGGVGLAGKLRTSLGAFENKMRGFATEEGVLVGVESRTSSPLRITRDKETLMSPSAVDLYPCGEGAGFAGGIVSAALDGMAVARAVQQRHHERVPDLS